MGYGPQYHKHSIRGLNPGPLLVLLWRYYTFAVVGTSRYLQRQKRSIFTGATKYSLMKEGHKVSSAMSLHPCIRPRCMCCHDHWTVWWNNGLGCQEHRILSILLMISSMGFCCPPCLLHTARHWWMSWTQRMLRIKQTTCAYHIFLGKSLQWCL